MASRLTNKVNDLIFLASQSGLRDSIAFKWADEIRETTLKEIEWSASRTGLINPVLVCYDRLTSEYQFTLISDAQRNVLEHFRDQCRV